MNRRFAAVLGALSIALVAVAMLVPGLVVGQAPSTAKPTTAKPWSMPRTVDGHPEIQGYWTNNTYTPLERAANVDKEFYTQEEADAEAARRLPGELAQTTPGTTADVHYDFAQFGLRRGQGERANNLRTSLIVDPPSGRVPARTPEFTARATARRYRGPGGATYDTVKNIPLGSRCVIGGIGTPIPMFPQGYNSNYQIMQGPNQVLILYENIGDVRIVYLDGRPAPPKNVTQWLGFSRGRWEGDTLIVETTNFNERAEGRHQMLQGVSADFKLVERFKRTGAEELTYEAVVNDPTSFAAPWTARIPFEKMEGPIFEPACHEGNYGIANTLAGARLEDKNPPAAAPAAGRGGAAPAGGQRGGGQRGGGQPGGGQRGGGQRGGAEPAGEQ